MISVHETEKLSLQQIEMFLVAANEERFEASEQEEVYGWIERLLCQQEYARQGRRARGLMRRYIGKAESSATDALPEPLPGHGAGTEETRSPLSLPPALHTISSCWRRSTKPMRA
jgi:hypothetical protein